jgi:hypothetical protein
MAGTLDPLNLLPDGSFAITVRPTTYIQNRELGAGVAEYVNVPTGAKYVVFGGDTSFAVRYNATQAGTAAATLADVTDGSGCEVNPTIRYLVGITEISVIARAAGNVSMTFFS